MALDPKFTGKTYPPHVYEAGREKIREYAMAIKNPDPHYVDEEFAKKSKYGTIIAPPTFAVLYGTRLIESIFYDREININLPMLVHGEQEYEFHEVVKAGDTITTTAQIMKIDSRERLDLMTVVMKSRNQHGRDVCTGTYTFAIRK